MNMENGFYAAASLALFWAAGMHRFLLLLSSACLLMACGTTGAAQAQVTQVEPATTTPIEAAAEYPERLRGQWMPKDMACPSPINYDSDSLIVIDKDRLTQYEDGNKPVLMRQISVDPQVWLIESLLNIAGDGYDTPVTEVFVLGDGGLTIVGEEEVGTYRKCD